jgi:type IV pilus assembly protein PilM
MRINFEELISQLKKQTDSAVGLDIGKDCIKLVELVREGELVSLSKIDSAKLPPAETTGPERTEAVKKIVAELLAKNQLKHKKIILGVNGQSVFIKFLEILPVSKDKLTRTIRYEAQQQIPFSLDDVEWDTHLLESLPEEKSRCQRVLLVAIKKDNLAAKLALVEQSGVFPSVLDVSTLSIYNCLKFNRDYDENKITAALDIGAQSTDLLILRGDELWVRSFAIGGDNLTLALKNKLNIGFADAQELKSKKSIDSPEVKEAIGPVIEDLQAEISRSIEYYFFQQKQPSLQAQSHSAQAQAQEPESAQGVSPAETNPLQNRASDAAGRVQNEIADRAGRIEEILLSGGASVMQGLDKFLAEKFSCNVRALEPFKMLSCDEAAKVRLNSHNKALFSQAVGLALRGVSKSYININLLKEQVKTKRAVRQRVMFGVGSVIIALLVLFGASTFMRRDYRERSSRLQYLKGWLNTFSIYQPQLERMQLKEELLSRKNAALASLALNRALWLEAFLQLQRILPDDLWLSEFSGTLAFDENQANFQSTLDLHGKAVSYEGVNSFVGALKSSPFFSEVKPLSSEFVEEPAADDKEKVEVVKFSISMKVLPIKKVESRE